MFKQRNKNGSNKRTKGKLEQWNAIFSLANQQRVKETNNAVAEDVVKLIFLFLMEM